MSKLVQPLYYENPERLGAYPRVLTECLTRGAQEHPDRMFIAEREGEGWRSLSWAAAYRMILALGQDLLTRGLSAERPLVLLSGGGVDHALLALAASHVGIPYAPISAAYATHDPTGMRLSQVLDLLTPGLAWIDGLDAAPVARALLAKRGIDVISSVAGDVARLAGGPITPAVGAAHAKIAPDDIRSFIFTSGTSGAPKAVINTHRMTSANQQMFVQSFPAFTRQPPEIVSWLPWHHTSGANSILGAVLYGGGSLWVDDGKPVTGKGMARTIENLRGKSPTAYFSAPSAFRMLAEHLANDADFAQDFFRKLQFFFYSGASMPTAIVHEMDDISIRTIGRTVPFYACYGATETAPFALATTQDMPPDGFVGTAMAGLRIKLAAVDGLREFRAKGASVTPGYWRDASATTAAFDEEGYYRYGDALVPLNAADLSQGFLFNGRLSENFKLATGTWVNTAGLREALMQRCGDILNDAVIVGEGQSNPGALLFAVKGQDEGVLRARITEALKALRAVATGSSTYIARAMVMTTPPDPARGEMTDKGAVSASNVRRHRQAEITMLFAADAAETELFFIA